MGLVLAMNEERGLKLQIKKALKKDKTSREAKVYSLTEFLG
jgi:hypothetical protein